MLTCWSSGASWYTAILKGWKSLSPVVARNELPWETVPGPASNPERALQGLHQPPMAAVSKCVHAVQLIVSSDLAQTKANERKLKCNWYQHPNTGCRQDISRPMHSQNQPRYSDHEYPQQCYHTHEPHVVRPHWT